MDPLLKDEKFPMGTRIVAYADDIALLVARDNRKDLIDTTEVSLEIIEYWASKRGLDLSKEKCVAEPLKGGLNLGFTMKFGENRVRSVNKTKYLGIQIEDKLRCDAHAIGFLESSTDMLSRLKSVRKSKWGTSSELALILYRAVYIPRITYGADTWYPLVRDEKIKD